MHIESLSGRNLAIALVSSSDTLHGELAAFIGGSATYSLMRNHDVMEALAHPDWRPDIVMLEIGDADPVTEMLANLTQRLAETPVIVCFDGASTGIPEDPESCGAATTLALPATPFEFRRALRVAERLLESRLLVRQLQAALAGEVRLEQIVARTNVMSNVVGLLRKACGNDINVLFEGEEGTGKEFCARAIHFNSGRAAGPFILLNCSAVPQHLLERDLFGCEAGVFGDDSEMLAGAIEQADGGTLLIDEIGAMDITVQARLFRCLQTRSFRRIGGETDMPLDARIITSTSMDLRALCGEGRFRDDLYFRLATFPIRIPALRDRIADIPVHVERLLRQYAESIGRPGIRISGDAILQLRRYRWPGNLSELEEVIERAVGVCETMEIQVGDLPHHLLVATGVRTSSETDSSPNGAGGNVATMDQHKARAVRLALEASHGNIKEAARLLDIGRTTIYKLIERYGIHV